MKVHHYQMQHTMAQKLIRAMLFPISQSYHIRYPAVQAVKQMAVPHWKINLPLNKMPTLYQCYTNVLCLLGMVYC